MGLVELTRAAKAKMTFSKLVSDTPTGVTWAHRRATKKTSFDDDR